jgi:hypothetical protein
MAIPAKDQRRQALLRKEPPGPNREFLESMLPDRTNAITRFERYARRAVQELGGWDLNQLSQRISNALEIPVMEGAYGEIKAEEEERKRMKARLQVLVKVVEPGGPK